MHSLPSSFFLPLLAVAGLPVILVLLRYVSGWAALARVYRAKQPYTGPSTAFQSASLNWTNFNNCLVLGADRTGLFISVSFPLTVAFSPLLIPWSDITATPKQGIFLKLMAFRFVQAPAVRFSVLERLGLELLAARPAAN